MAASFHEIFTEKVKINTYKNSSCKNYHSVYLIVYLRLLVMARALGLKDPDVL